MEDSIKDTVHIVSISPDISMPLCVGDSVEIEIEVEFKVSTLPATVTLNVQNGDFTEQIFKSILEIKDVSEQKEGLNSFILATKTIDILEKQGRAKIKVSFIVPMCSSIQIFSPVMVQGEDATNIIDNRFYVVISK